MNDALRYFEAAEQYDLYKDNAFIGMLYNNDEFGINDESNQYLKYHRIHKSFLQMSKYKIYIDDEEQDEIFDSEEEAEEYAQYLCSCARTGAEILNMSNPGDYEYDEDSFEEPDYEVVEVDD